MFLAADLLRYRPSSVTFRRDAYNSGYKLAIVQSPAAPQPRRIDIPGEPAVQSALLRLLHHTIVKAFGDDEGTLTMEFDDGQILQCLEARSPYESYQIIQRGSPNNRLSSLLTSGAPTPVTDQSHVPFICPVLVFWGLDEPSRTENVAARTGGPFKPLFGLSGAVPITLHMSS